MTASNLLICFDAFGTLFKPRRPVFQQYGEVARSLGLAGFTNDDIDRAFRNAYKTEAKQNPNYGKATGMGSETWWTHVIENTFLSIPHVNPPLPNELVPRLLHRFWCDEGYAAVPGALSLVRRVRTSAEKTGHRVIVGVITNSDDRVPDILTGLGWRVSPLRFGGNPPKAPDAETDIDFSIMSYDAGHEKPDKRIFDAAVTTLESIIDASAADGNSLPPLSTWDKIYIGDEYQKDVVGSTSAGWKAVLIDDSRAEHPDLSWPEDGAPQTLFDSFEQSRALGFSSFEKLAEHLPT